MALSAWAQYADHVSRERLVFRMNPTRIPDLNKWLVEAGAQVQSISSKHSFETYFLNITSDATAAHRAI